MEDNRKPQKLDKDKMNELLGLGDDGSSPKKSSEGKREEKTEEKADGKESGRGRGRPKGSTSTKPSREGLRTAAASQFGENKREKDKYDGELHDFLFKPSAVGGQEFNVSFKLENAQHERYRKLASVIPKGKMNWLIYHILEDFYIRNEKDIEKKIKDYFLS